MKILLETKEYKEIDIELPFYAYCQEEDKEIFVMIDEKEFKEIVIHSYGQIEMLKCSSSGSLAVIWYENKSNKDQWDETVELAKNYANAF